MKPAAYVLYTNHRGEKAWRIIVPVEVWYGRTGEHPEACHLLRVQALDRDMEERDFKLANIHEWRDDPPPGMLVD